MAKIMEQGKPAKCNYRSVKYSHIAVNPDEMSVLTADPWSYLHGDLLKKVKKSAGENRKGFERANYYSKLAEDFYSAAESVEILTKGTLYYYGMMNLVKAYLATQRVSLEDIVEHHGITNTHGRKHSLTISGSLKNCTNIFLEFAKLLGTPVTGKQEINIRHIFTHIPELHAISTSMGFVKKPRLLPINIEFMVNSSNTHVFTEVVFDKSFENICDTNKFFQGNRKKYFKEGAPREGKIVYRSEKNKSLSKENWPRVYKNIVNEYSKFNITSILTRTGYRYYCSLQDSNFHYLCNSYLIMFYIGHAARYRPTEMKEILEGEFRPIVTEALALCPKQFLYQLVSLITNKICVIPYSDF